MASVFPTLSLLSDVVCLSLLSDVVCLSFLLFIRLTHCSFLLCYFMHISFLVFKLEGY